MSKLGVFDTMMEDLFGNFKFTKEESLVKTGATTTKSYSSESDDRGMYLYVDLPGIDPKTISLTVSRTQVIVTGPNGDKTFTHRYTISDEFDVRTATAAWRHGRLDVRIMRATTPEFQKVKIEIKS